LLSLPTAEGAHFGEEKSRAHQTVPFCYTIKRNPDLHIDINERDTILVVLIIFLACIK